MSPSEKKMPASSYNGIILSDLSILKPHLPFNCTAASPSEKVNSLYSNGIFSNLLY
jgi:hypothetical protein